MPRRSTPRPVPAAESAPRRSRPVRVLADEPAERTTALYVVTGLLPIHGAKTGETVELSLTDAELRRHISAGHIAPAPAKAARQETQPEDRPTKAVTEEE